MNDKQNHLLELVMFDIAYVISNCDYEYSSDEKKYLNVILDRYSDEDKELLKLRTQFLDSILEKGIDEVKKFVVNLSKSLKNKIDGKILIHDSAHNSAGMLRKGHSEIKEPSETPGARHPIAITDQKTNKKFLFLGRRPHAYIIGLDINESEDLLDAIWDHATQEKYTWTQKWEKGDLLMWKNLNVLHKRDAFDPNTRRVMHRTQLKGETKIYA